MQLEHALPHKAFLGINDKGQIATFKAKGNISSHIILRGGIQTEL